MRTTSSRLSRRATVLPALVLALVASACTTRNVASVPEGDVPTPDETPIVEPVSPPATDVDRPDEDGPEDGVPEDNDLGSDDGEQ